jgi:hypothetical protein
MSTDKIYVGILAQRMTTGTSVQYTAGPYYYPKTDEDWNHLQDSLTSVFRDEYGNGWSFHVYEIPKNVYEEYKQQTEELFNGSFK